MTDQQNLESYIKEGTGQVSLVVMILPDERVKFMHHICEQSNKQPVIKSSTSIFDIGRSNC